MIKDLKTEEFVSELSDEELQAVVGGALIVEGNLPSNLLGTRISEATISNLGVNNFRVITPGSALTLDYNPERLNINVDANNVITNVFYG